MMLVTAIVPSFALHDVRAGLDRLDVAGMTVSEASGHGRLHGHTGVHRGVDHQVDSGPTVRIELLVDDDAVDTVIDTVTRAVPTGEIGDGRVWVGPGRHGGPCPDGRAGRRGAVTTVRILCGA